MQSCDLQGLLTFNSIIFCLIQSTNFRTKYLREQLIFFYISSSIKKNCNFQHATTKRPRVMSNFLGSITIKTAHNIPGTQNPYNDLHYKHLDPNIFSTVLSSKMKLQDFCFLMLETFE